MLRPWGIRVRKIDGSASCEDTGMHSEQYHSTYCDEYHKAIEDGAERDIIAPVLEDFPRLKPLLDRVGGTLSGGEQQLLAIARCLCGKPRLVLLDEPTEGIQPSIIDEIVETLRRLRDKSGLTMILVEQNLDFIAALSQRVLIIQKGMITREARPSDLGDPGLVGEFIGVTG